MSAIAVLENGERRENRERFAMLGGHAKTIAKGFEEMGVEPTDELPDKVRALAYHFSLIHERNKLLEKACRIWNQGDNWWTPKGRAYWLGVEKYTKIYNGG